MNSSSLLKNFAIFTEKHLRWGLFLNKSAGLQSWNFIKNRLQHRFFPVNIAKFLKAPILQNICERLFEPPPTWASNVTNNMEIEEGIFSKRKHGDWRWHFLKNKKKHSKFTFSWSCWSFFFLYMSTACLRRRFPYIIKDDRSEGL